jgi:hypothetical protein
MMNRLTADDPEDELQEGKYAGLSHGVISRVLYIISTLRYGTIE